MISIDFSTINTVARQQYLQAAIGPRPIAFASTIDLQGRRNLSPFSFFNVFSANPPMLIFSPARRVRDNTTKHTLENIQQVPEVVINVVNYAIVHQASLSSVEYPKGVDEFVKAGFTPLDSDLVKPCRVKESPVQMECSVEQIIALGNEGGAGNLILCKVLKMHIDELVCNAQGQIDQQKIDLVARMGGNWYCRAYGAALFEVEKPVSTLGIGVDLLPENIRTSSVLCGNHLGMLGNVEAIPVKDANFSIVENETVKNLIERKGFSTEDHHSIAAALLDEGKINEAWQVLLQKL